MSAAGPCWTGLAGRSVCSRGGSGCPLPHADDPPELRRHSARGVLAGNPLDGGVEYPRDIAQPTCPEHHCSQTVGFGAVQCWKCPGWRRALQRWRLTRWTREWQSAGRRKAKFMAELYRVYGRANG